MAISHAKRGNRMIKGIKYLATNDVLIEVDLENKKADIKFSDVAPYWSYANEEDFEGGFAKVFEDKVLFSVVTASGQGGIIAVWDGQTQKIVHVSEGAYCVAADVYDGKIYRLLCVSNFVTKSHFELWETAIGSFDANEEGTRVDTEISSVDDKYNGVYSSIELKVTNNSFVIKIDEEEFLLPVSCL